MMYEILIISVAILSFILLAMMVYLVKQGVFTRVKPAIEVTGGFAITKQAFEGNPNNVLVSLEKQIEILKSLNIGYAHPICTYHDIPENKSESTKSDIGFVLYKGSKESLIELGKQVPLDTFEKKERIVIRFPFKGRLSIQFGIMKAYPALERFAKKNNLEPGNITEMYNGLEKQIEYMMDFNKR